MLEIINAKEAENYGIEVEGTPAAAARVGAARSLEGLRLYGNFGWLHGEYHRLLEIRNFAAGRRRRVPVTIDFSGNRLQNAPEYKVSATAEWTFDLGRWGYLIPRYDFSWTDDVFFDPNEGRGSVDPTGGPALPEFAIGQNAVLPAQRAARLSHADRQRRAGGLGPQPRRRGLQELRVRRVALLRDRAQLPGRAAHDRRRPDRSRSERRRQPGTA